MLATGKGGAVHRCIHAVNHLIEDHAAHAGLPVRFAATKLVEGDPLIEKALDLDENEKELLGHTIAELESETGLDREAAWPICGSTSLNACVKKPLCAPAKAASTSAA